MNCQDKVEKRESATKTETETEEIEETEEPFEDEVMKRHRARAVEYHAGIDENNPVLSAIREKIVSSSKLSKDEMITWLNGHGCYVTKRDTIAKLRKVINEVINGLGGIPIGR